MGSYTMNVPKIELISECFVKPTFETPRKPVYLGVLDLFMLTMDTMQKGLLFNTKLHPHTLNKLEKSIAVSLVHFYPLAGRLATKKFHDEHACCFYVDCKASPGARLAHAAANFTVSNILSSVDVHPIVQSFFDMGEKSVNYDGHTRPLLSIQVTELVDGVFIGFTMNHCVADGTSLWHFISTLSEMFGQIKDEDENEDKKKSLEFSISREPICDTLFPTDVSSECPIYKLPYLEPEEFVTRYDPGPLRVRLFRFSYKSISLLKAQSNKECGLDNSISSFQALCGFIWRSITRARNLQPDDEVRSAIIMNARTLFDPPYPPEYFRCFLMSTEAVSKVDDLMRNDVGRAAMLVNKSIKTQDNKTTLLGMIKYFEENPCVILPGSKSPYYKPNSLTIGGSPRFDMYGPEFGLGKAVAVLAGYSSREDGKVTANPGREGGGSVDLEVCLKPETMNALELDEDFMRFCY